MDAPEFYNDNVFFLWGWSNILLTEDIASLVVQCKISGKEIIHDDENSVIVKVGAGENRADFVTRCCENNYAWVENLSLIPGTVWTAPIQNIGAYWVEAKDTITDVEWIYLDTKDMLTLPNSECQFWYRQSIFKKDLKDMFFITAVYFKLQKVTTSNYSPDLSYGAIQKKLEEKWVKINDITPLIISETISEIRRWKLPDYNNLWTAGSFFKNPIISKAALAKLHLEDPTLKSRDINTNAFKISAGQLIENCWLKWHRMPDSDAATYDKHALVLVNHWNAKWSDIVELAEYIQKCVKDKYWVDLEPEVNYV